MEKTKEVKDERFGQTVKTRLRKVFITTWSVQHVHHKDAPIEFVLPDDIPMNELHLLIGRKTRVTVEVLPW